MTPEYDIFLPTGAGYRVKPPCTVTVLKSDGSLITRDIKYMVEIDELKPYAAFKIHKPVDPMQYVIEDLWNTCGVSRYQARKVLDYLNDQGLLKVDGQPSTKKDWLDEKMDSLGFPYSRYQNLRKNIRNWFENPEKYPEVNYDLKNRILTVKQVAGGRVVVLPTGHTIAYSKAKQVYDAFVGRSDHLQSGVTIPVGEYIGGSIKHRRYALRITTIGVTVGCQTVPREAIMELAEREGW